MIEETTPETDPPPADAVLDDAMDVACRFLEIYDQCMALYEATGNPSPHAATALLASPDAKTQVMARDLEMLSNQLARVVLPPERGAKPQPSEADREECLAQLAAAVAALPPEAFANKDAGPRAEVKQPLALWTLTPAQLDYLHLPPQTDGMTRPQYDAALEALRQAFPFLSGVLLSPAPADIHSIGRALAILLLAYPGRARRIEVAARAIYRIGLDSDGKLKIDSFSPRLCYTRLFRLQKSRVIKKFLGGDDGEQRSKFSDLAARINETCPLCGNPLLPGGSNLKPEVVLRRRRPCYTHKSAFVQLGQINDYLVGESFKEDIRAVLLDENKLGDYVERSKGADTTAKERSKRVHLSYHAEGVAGRYLVTLPVRWKEVLQQFEQAFPNFTALAHVMRNAFSLQALGDRRVYLPPQLLAGGPGIGKTEAARWLCENLGVSFAVLDMASAETAGALSGHEPHWTSSDTGLVFDTLIESNHLNPVLLLDEIDKATKDSRYNPINALYTLLEPRSARFFEDKCIPNVQLDASHVIWIATANDVGDVPAPIRSRFNILEIPDPTPDQVAAIARRIYEQLRSSQGWADHFPSELPGDVIGELKQYQPRQVRRALIDALGKAAYDGRRSLEVGDLSLPQQFSKPRMGFAPG